MKTIVIVLALLSAGPALAQEWPRDGESTLDYLTRRDYEIDTEFRLRDIERQQERIEAQQRQIGAPCQFGTFC